STAKLEATGDGQQHVVRSVAVDVDAHLGRGEEVGARAVNVETVVRKTKLVERRRSDDVVLEEGARRRRVVAATDARDEQVLLRSREAERRRRELRRSDVARKH